jgi:hypothetical protein
MKKSIIYLFLFMMMFVGFEQVDAKQPMELKIGNGEVSVNQLDGTAEVLGSGQNKWRSLKLKDKLKAGDEVRTGPKTRLELIMADYSTIRFADNSHFKIFHVEAGTENKPRNVKVHMAVGRSWVNLSRAVGKKGRFDLTCENAVVGVRGTTYRINVKEDQSALIRVYNGQVSVSGGGDVTAEMEDSMIRKANERLIHMGIGISQ